MKRRFCVYRQDRGTAAAADPAVLPSCNSLLYDCGRAAGLLAENDIQHHALYRLPADPHLLPHPYIRIFHTAVFLDTVLLHISDGNRCA